MALLQRRAGHTGFSVNKEPEWSSFCDNVFDQYLDDGDLFGLDANNRGRSSPDDSVNLFDFSGASEQSHQTNATSPVPSGESFVPDNAIEAQQPRAKEPVNFWTKTLQALEQNAAECERQQQKLRSTKSHPDFLSLGGCPSPPAGPVSPTDQSFSAQRRVSRSAANGKRRNITARSVSRGRPSSVAKATVAGSTNSYATSRKCSASPPKMMNPSRYRSGFRDVWADKLQYSPGKYELRVPSNAFPASPPPSARGPFDDDHAAFGSPSHHSAMPHYDEQISPLTNTFQRARLYTPVLSPTINEAAQAHNSYITGVPPSAVHPYPVHSLPVSDTAPLYPERTTSLAPENIQAFDFGFSSPTATGPHEPGPGVYSTHYAASNPFGPIHDDVLPSIEHREEALAGLGISCDPVLVASPYHASLMTSGLPGEPLPGSRTHRMPLQSPHHTPHHRAKSCQRSLSPSPPITEPRQPRSGKRTSSARRTSRHRRAKSTNATPRQPQVNGAGFVNFTPQDSSKILSGVAPSGSSKTKARREKEALEKRRRLSQAAVRAVVEAGGDIEALNKAGLLA